MHFVHRGPLRLYVMGEEWLLKGMDVPEALQLAAGGPEPRSQMLYLLDRAQTLGLNTLRFRAFADGAPGVGSATARQWSQQQQQDDEEEEGPRHSSLQPAPGVLNGTMLREGLDWLVHECGLRGIRVLPVLTNGGSTAGGGMLQYIDWIDPALTVTDFYKNDTIKSVFLDYVAAMLGHVSSLSGLPLREDPAVLGWQLTEDASHPGTPSSQTLLAWLRQFGVYVKQRAPHQLLLTGVKDLFGHNSPHHLQHNPRAQVFDAASHSAHVYEPRCHGVDFWLHNQIPEVDAVAAGVFPDMHVACNATCKLDWTREWIRAHLRDALRMNKPLIVGGVGALRPHSWRLQVLQVVQEEVQRALKYRHPIGGFIMSGLSHPDMPDTTGWGTYYTSKGVNKERPALDSLNTQAVADVEWRSFLNYDAFLACQAQQTRGSSNDKGEASNTAVWVEGWDDVMRAVAALGALPDAWQPTRAAA